MLEVYALMYRYCCNAPGDPELVRLFETEEAAIQYRDTEGNGSGVYEILCLDVYK